MIKMKIVNIVGGLGNQMFQYAFFLSLREKGIDAKIDVSNFADYYSHNGLEIEKVFNISLQNNIVENNNLKDNKPNFKYRKLLGLLFGDVNKYVRKSHFIQKNYSEYIHEVYKINKPVFFDGYWQNEKYFSAVNEKIKEIYSWDEKNISKENSEILSLINNTESVSLHIRKQDRIRSIKELTYGIKNRITYKETHISYYSDAVNFVKSKTNNSFFFIFSNNTEWIRENLASLNLKKEECIIVDVNSGKNSNLDMFLMSKCKHNIISASTFSWWSAWLNNNKNKIVIVPKGWNVRFAKDKGIIPSNWLQK